MAAAAVTGALLAVSPGIAFAATSTYTWSGADSAAATSSNWSDPGNWIGDAAPTSGTEVDLDFPSLNCGSSPCGNTGVNDLTSLKVDHLDLTVASTTAGPGYSLSGNGIKIGTVDITSAAPTGPNGQGANLQVPLSLKGTEKWSIDAEDNSNINLGPITGAGADRLTVDLPVADGGSGGGFVAAPSFDAGPLSFQGFVGDSDSYVTGATSINGTTGKTVSFDQTALFETGPSGSTTKDVTVKYGPLTISDSTVFLGNGHGGPYGIDSVAGSASLDSGTNLNFNSLDQGSGSKPAAGLSYPQLKATGNIDLGSANLGVFAACSQKLGTVYTLVNAGSVTGTFQNMSNGSVFQANGDSSPKCTTGSPPYLQINYGLSTVTATVVAAPTGSVAGLHRDPVLVPHVDGHSFQMVEEG